MLKSSGREGMNEDEGDFKHIIYPAVFFFPEGVFIIIFEISTFFIIFRSIKKDIFL